MDSGTPFQNVILKVSTRQIPVASRQIEKVKISLSRVQLKFFDILVDMLLPTASPTKNC